MMLQLSVELIARRNFPGVRHPKTIGAMSVASGGRRGNRITQRFKIVLRQSVDVLQQFRPPANQRRHHNQGIEGFLRSSSENMPAIQNPAHRKHAKQTNPQPRFFHHGSFFVASGGTGVPEFDKDADTGLVGRINGLGTPQM